MSVVSLGSEIRCAGCGAPPASDDPYGWVCPNRHVGDDVDHVMARRLLPVVSATGVVSSESENPFVRYRKLLHSYHRWRAAGRDDDSFVSLVEKLDAAVAAVDGRGFRRTPLVHAPTLDVAVGSPVWVKDETGNVAGSHKGRHLFGLAILLQVVEPIGRARSTPPPLAIASCGNAALAAAVVAAAAGRHLDVFIPEDAETSVVERLAALGARLTVCRRDPSQAGDPCYHRFTEAVAGGAIPFGCQGPDNGLTIEGGQTLAWEIAEHLAAHSIKADRLVVQVGGGALASSCVAGLGEAVSLGVLPNGPRIDTVQTSGAAPLARAVALLRERSTPLDEAVQHRSAFMWPWEPEPTSVARAILDDETYDWVAVVRGMADSGGSAIVVDEATLIEANTIARRTTGIDVDPTGSAGLAGLMQLAGAGLARPDETSIVIFSGVAR